MMEHISNPWVARFEPLLNTEEIIRRSKNIPDPLIDLNSFPIEVACKKLGNALEGIFIPTLQCVEILHRWVGFAHAHSLQFYADSRACLSGVYSNNSPLPDFSFPICIASWAGCGKTELVKAFLRILDADSEVHIDDKHSPFPLRACWAVKVNAHSSTKGLMALLAGQDGNLPNSVKVCRKRAFRDGVSILLADELQFLTQSADANARVTQMLLSMSYIGIPFFYIANSSLLHRLMKRPQEDRHRLLADHSFLFPDSPNSKDWGNTLSAYKDIAPEVMRFDVEKDGVTIHRYTAGIKRALARLFCISYRIARASSGVITIHVIEKAFHSSRYTAYRKDVEDIARQLVTNQKVPGRDDLWCPIDLPKMGQSDTEEELRKERGKLVADEKIKSSMTASERVGLDKLENSKNNNREKAKVITLKSKIPVTADKLKEDAEWFKNQK